MASSVDLAKFSQLIDRPNPKCYSVYDVTRHMYIQFDVRYVMDWIREIETLKKEKNALILAHHYQCESVKAVADFVGDSLEMARIAARSDSEVLVICGVYFMGETAKILSPDKVVLMPRLDAGCPMADMVTAEALIEEKAKHPKAQVVCYVNSPAEVKAESTICCTSSNAEKIVRSLDADEIVFVPDQNLAHYVQTQVPEKRILPWRGFCPTHHRMTSEEVARTQSDYPDAYVMAHPECRREVLEMADFIGSTSQIIKRCSEIDAETVVIGTEAGVIEPIRAQNPDKTIVLLDDAMVCPNMKKTDLASVYHVLKTGENAIEIDSEVSARAYGAISRMLEVK